MQHRSTLLGHCGRISAGDVVATFRSIIIFYVSSLIVPLEWHKAWYDIENFKFPFFKFFKREPTPTFLNNKLIKDSNRFCKAYHQYLNPFQNY